MRKVFRLLRRNRFINLVVRRILLSILVLTKKAISYWHVSGDILYKTGGYSVKLFAHADDALTSKLYYHQKWEDHILKWFIHFSKRSLFIIDAGANIGLFSLVASKANPKALIHSFEPNPSNIDRLKLNIRLNKEVTITVHPLALGEVDSEIDFYLPVDNRISDVSSVFQGHSRAFNHFEHKRVSVKSVSLDSFFENRKQKIDLLKIDVELYELYVLKGMRGILVKDRPIIFCEIFNDKIKRKQNPQIDSEIPLNYTVQIADFLKSLNYHFYSVTPDGLIEVKHFTYSPMSSMYLLFPRQLTMNHYFYSERESIES